ncbi:MAG: SPASM domain-containing protein [Candidatus Hydrogenedentota bacterium]
MPQPALHRFEHNGRRFAIDPDACFCFECDDISWDVLAYYPQETANRIAHLLADRHDPAVVAEVVSELDWLRATKAILKVPEPEQIAKQYEVVRGLHTVTVRLHQPPDAAIVDQAAALLLGRAGEQKHLTLTLLCPATRIGRDAPRLVAPCQRALTAGSRAGKQLTVALRATGVPATASTPGLEPHALDLQITCTGRPGSTEVIASVRECFEQFGKARFDRLKGLPGQMQAADEGVSGQAILRPGTPELAPAVEALDNAGFSRIAIDLDQVYTAHPESDPAAMQTGLEQAAVYYANRLLRHHYFRLDPIAGVFRHIYEGEGVFRADPTGTNALAIDTDGAIYPNPAWFGWERHRLGSLDTGIDEAALARFEDLGALTTPACMTCWARGLCGGGPAVVHEALSGTWRTPHEPWCNAQRDWLEGAVSAFNVLSSAGVNFTRVYKQLGPVKRPSLFSMAKTAFRMQIGLRPIAEADAALLARWESWNDAAYFTAAERSMFLTTSYDREMDALYPPAYEQEFMLLKKDGQPIGLLRVRPDRIPGTARAWIYLHNPADYADRGVRRSFRTVLKEAAGQEALRRITVAAGPKEAALAEFLEAAGFALAGVEREALYLHAAYHDLRIFSAALDQL